MTDDTSLTHGRRVFTAIVNPISGGGRADAVWGPLSVRLQHAGYRVETVHSRNAEHAIDAAFDAAAHSVVVAVGGDGLVRDVATGVVRAEGTMAIVPAGRGNDLVRALCIPSAPDMLFDYLTSTPERRIDVLEVGDRFVPGNAYAGIDGRATGIINANRWLHPRVLYRVAPFVAAIAWRPFKLTLACDGMSPQSQWAHMVVIANSGRYGNGLDMVPTASLDDGYFDVLTIEGVPVLRLARISAQAKTGAHMARPEVTVARATDVTLTADCDLALFADGDRIGSLPCTVHLRPLALRIVAPTSLTAMS